MAEVRQATNLFIKPAFAIQRDKTHYDCPEHFHR
jgi:hypothetical protein